MRDLPFGLVRVLDDSGEASGPWNPKLPTETLLAGLRAMLLTRAFDERLFRAHRQGKTSFYMKSTGEEAIGAAQVGHVHLSVGDIASAAEFYVSKLGFDRTIEIPGQAVFVSAGGYHHHMAMNVWNSRGAGPRMPTLGLGRIARPWRRRWRAQPSAG